MRDQTFEKADLGPGVPHQFGMPLYADQEGRPRALHGFDHAIRRSGRYLEAPTRSADGLPVAAVDPGVFPQQPVAP